MGTPNDFWIWGIWGRRECYAGMENARCGTARACLRRSGIKPAWDVVGELRTTRCRRKKTMLRAVGKRLSMVVNTLCNSTGSSVADPEIRTEISGGLDFRPPVDGLATAPGLDACDQATRVVAEANAVPRFSGCETHAVEALEQSNKEQDYAPDTSECCEGCNRNSQHLAQIESRTISLCGRRSEYWVWQASSARRDQTV